MIARRVCHHMLGVSKQSSLVTRQNRHHGICNYSLAASDILVLTKNTDANLYGNLYRNRRMYHASPIILVTPKYNNNQDFDEIRNNERERTKHQRSSYRDSVGQFRSELVNRTHELIHDEPIGSLTKEHIEEIKSLLYQWPKTLNKRGKSSLTPDKVYDVATIMKAILYRLIAEYDEGVNENALVITVKEYNVVMNAFSRYLGQSNDYNKLRKVKFGSSKSDSGEKGVKMVESLYNSMKDRHENYKAMMDDDFNVIAPKPDNITYNTLLSAYSSQVNDEESMHKAEAIIELLESDKMLEKTNTVSYNCLMNSYANQLGEYGYAQKAEDVLLLMSKKGQEGNIGVLPDATSFNIVMKAWRNSGIGSIESAQRAFDILKLMMKLYNEGHDDVRPDGASISTVIHAFVQPPLKVDDEILKKFESIADFLLKDSDDYLIAHPESVIRAINTIIDMVSKSDIKQKGREAEHFLQKLQETSLSKSNHKLAPDMTTYSNVIGTYINDGDIKTAISILDEMENGDNSILRPNSFCYNKCLNYYCNNKNIDAAEILYGRMKALAREETNNFNTFDPVTFNIMMKMYLGVPGKTEQAINVLDDMESMYDMGVIKSLEIFPYQACLEKIQKARSKQKKTGHSGQAYDLLMRMISLNRDMHLNEPPDLISYNLVLSTLTKDYNEEAARKAMLILDLMGNMSNRKKNVQPDTHSFNHAIMCWSRSGATDSISNILQLLERMESRDVRSNGKLLDATTFETILQHFVHSKQCEREAIEQVLERIYLLSKNCNEFTPSSTCFNLVLKAKCLDKETGDGSLYTAHQLLFELLKKHKAGELAVIPDVIGFNTVISNWSKRPHGAAIKEVEEILKTMEKLYNDGNQTVKPDQYTYSTALKVYARNIQKDTPERAEKVVEKAEKYLTKVDKYVYNGLLGVWANAKTSRKAIKARKWLLAMIEKNIVDVSSFNIVLKACSHTYGNEKIQKKTLKIALQVYDDLLNSNILKADHITFASALRAVNHLSKNDEARPQHLKKIFNDCCSRGLLSQLVISQLQRSIPPGQRLELLGHDLSSPFVKEWKENL